MPRLFVAVWPPEDVIAELTALARKDRRGIRFVEPERWHLTLRFLGDAAVDDAAEALDRAELPAATVRLGPAVDVLDERALVIPASGLDHLAAAVNSATADVGEAPRRRFRGHLTVARVKASASMPPLLGALVEASFEASEVALVESTLHPDGARYDTIATWPLGVSPWWTYREDEAPARPPSAAATGSVGSAARPVRRRRRGRLPGALLVPWNPRAWRRHRYRRGGSWSCRDSTRSPGGALRGTCAWSTLGVRINGRRSRSTGWSRATNSSARRTAGVSIARVAGRSWR
ncbi:MAG: RNA 2',3'-cyclic phosphodiesterase [Microthrixaceae bacterium]